MTTLDKSSSLIELPSYETYLATRNEYLANALECIRKEELRKASELLWGAITQSIKALAALVGIPLSRHADFFPFMRELGSELDDPKLDEDFRVLNDLHRNFYDEYIPADSFPRIYERTSKFLERLNGLIEMKLKEMRQKDTRTS